MVIRRIEFLLPDFLQVASSRAIGIRLGGVRTCAFLGAATTVLVICPFPRCTDIAGTADAPPDRRWR